MTNITRTIYFHKNLLKEIDKVTQDCVSRSYYVNQAIKEKLERDNYLV